MSGLTPLSCRSADDWKIQSPESQCCAGERTLRPLTRPRFHVERRTRQRTVDGAFHVKHAIEIRDFICRPRQRFHVERPGGQVRGISCRVFHVEHECRPSAAQATSIDRCLKFRGSTGTATPSPGGLTGRSTWNVRGQAKKSRVVFHVEHKCRPPPSKPGRLAAV
jgi:hypothetical protein